MGGVFVLTAESKRRNEELSKRRTMLELVGYNKRNPAPEDLEFHHIYRYVLGSGKEMRMGYLLPVKEDDKTVYALLVLGLDGTFLELHRTEVAPGEVTHEEKRESALEKVLEGDETSSLADMMIIARLRSQRLAYLVPGEFPGFKTLIHVMLALDQDFRILGLEVVEHEEDPGLGAEIEEPYFEEQFEGLDYETISHLEVVKRPLPKEYREYLEASEKKRQNLFSRKEMRRMKEKYQDEEIHAITGATISSEAVTEGVKKMVRKFSFRMELLDEVVGREEISVVF
jgi:electron transport complex protein RnfG